MTKMQTKAVEAYFVGQNLADASSVVNLFTEDAEVYNVNFPKFSGKSGIQAFCENLYDRTSARNFEIIGIAQGENGVVMAHWKVAMTFRSGAKIGPSELARSFEVCLQGINKFVFDTESGLIRELRVFHETTTVGQLAKENAKA